jgi:hypothetical protein
LALKESSPAQGGRAGLLREAEQPCSGRLSSPAQGGRAGLRQAAAQSYPVSLGCASCGAAVALALVSTLIHPNRVKNPVRVGCYPIDPLS